MAFFAGQDHQYDIILPTVQKINQRTVAEARRNRPTVSDAKPVRSGGSDLTALATVDLNWDNSPDLVSGSQDGSFYVPTMSAGHSRMPSRSGAASRP
jgi:hypothetical protein